MTGALLTGFHQLRTIWWRLRRPVTLGVRVAPLNGRGEVLLVRHTYMPGWFIPGGALDAGERLAEGAARELREEVGLSPLSPPEFVGIFSYFRYGKSDHLAVFRAQVEGEPRIDRFEIAEARWFSLTALPEGLSPATRDGLDAALRAL